MKMLWKYFAVAMVAFVATATACDGNGSCQCQDYVMESTLHAPNLERDPDEEYLKDLCAEMRLEETTFERAMESFEEISYYFPYYEVKCSINDPELVEAFRKLNVVKSQNIKLFCPFVTDSQIEELLPNGYHVCWRVAGVVKRGAHIVVDPSTGDVLGCHDDHSAAGVNRVIEENGQWYWVGKAILAGDYTPKEMIDTYVEKIFVKMLSLALKGQADEYYDALAVQPLECPVETYDRRPALPEETPSEPNDAPVEQDEASPVEPLEGNRPWEPWRDGDGPEPIF